MGKSEGRTYAQCTFCGKIYNTDDEIDVEELYINSYCPRCGHAKALHIGNNPNDVYLYYNPHNDERYYNY